MEGPDFALRSLDQRRYNGIIVERNDLTKDAVTISHLIDDTSYSEDRLIQQMYQTMRAFSKTLNNKIAATGIYSSEWSILKLVQEHEGVSQLELIAYLCVEPAAVSKTLSRLEKKGIIERRYLPGERGKHIFLTSAGADCCAPLELLAIEHRRQALHTLSEAEQQQLFYLMRQIYQNVGE